MSYRVVVPKAVQKQLEVLFQPMRGRILEKVATLATDPRPRGSVKLQGQTNEYRIRIGDFRVRYLVDDTEAVVVLLHCKHRREVYRSR